ncbi:MAG: hypothetical protein ABR498_01785, partial [Candidatus Dormibacteria bacterium]
LLDELIVRQRRRVFVLAVLTAALAVAQFLIAEEIFVTELLAAVVVTVVCAAFNRGELRRRTRYVWRVLRIAVPIVAVVLAAPVAVQFLGPNRTGTGTAIHSPDIFLADAFNVVLPTSVQWLSPGPVQRLTTHFTGNLSEWDGYFGIPMLVLLGYTVFRFWRVPLVRVAAITGVVVTVLSFGPHLHGIGRRTPIPLPWWIAAHVPVLNNVQPNRLMLFVYLAAGIVVAYGLREIAAMRVGRLGALATAVVAFAPLVPVIPLMTTPLPPSSSAAALATAQALPVGPVVATAPWSDQLNTSGMVLQYSVDMRFRMPGGYFIGNASPATAQLKAALDDIEQSGIAPPLNLTNSAAMRDELRRSGVTAVIALPSPYHDTYVAFLTTIIGSAPTVNGDIGVWTLPTPSP